jgi:hypothetical protein
MTHRAVFLVLILLTSCRASSAVGKSEKQDSETNLATTVSKSVANIRRRLFSNVRKLQNNDTGDNYQLNFTDGENIKF